MPSRRRCGDRAAVLQPDRDDRRNRRGDVHNGQHQLDRRWNHDWCNDFVDDRNDRWDHYGNVDNRDDRNDNRRRDRDDHRYEHRDNRRHNNRHDRNFDNRHDHRDDNRRLNGVARRFMESREALGWGGWAAAGVSGSATSARVSASAWRRSSGWE
jgi:hypothetical protein